MRTNQYIVIKGRLTADAELSEAKGGKSYSRFRVAVNEKGKKEGEEVTNFYGVVCFDKTAEIFSKLKKADYVRVEGRLEVSTYKDKKDETQIDLSIVADEIMKSDFVGGEEEK